MRLSVFSVAAFLACGLLVLGRPLITGEEGISPILPYNIASTSPFSSNSPGTDLTQPENPTNLDAYFTSLDKYPVSSPEVPGSDTYEKLAFSGAGVSPETSLTSNPPSAFTPGTSSSLGSTLFPEPGTFGETANPFTPPSTAPSLEIALSISEDSNIKIIHDGIGGYCIFELSSDFQSLEYRKCGNPGGLFRTDFNDKTPGCALFFNGGSVLLSFCESGDLGEGTIQKFRPQWEKSIRKYFGDLPITRVPIGVTPDQYERNNGVTL